MRIGILGGTGPAGSALAVRPFVRPIPSRTVGAAWRKSSARTEALQAVCDVIGAVTGER
jgi:DNA-binding transcriptional LysR family regulator